MPCCDKTANWSTYSYLFIIQLKKLQERFAKEEELRKELEDKLTKLMEEKNELFQNLQSVRR